ncbi:MAG: glycine--tRNA ligase subunit beta, partial [Rubrivivax sp.]|nr:glycine--tRNA ligase subunit beta [Rubrivivax sp.]
MDTKNLLVELFVEELPPKALKQLGNAFADKIFNVLVQHQLKLRDPRGMEIFASPRRLAVFIPEVMTRAEDRSVSQKLMPAAVGLDTNGNATPALLKKLSALDADAAAVPQLRRESDGKVEMLYFDSMLRGATLAE